MILPRYSVDQTMDGSRERTDNTRTPEQTPPETPSSTENAVDVRSDLRAG